MTAQIFISYRRGDVRAVAARIRDRLASHFGSGSVFMDVEDLVAGQRFDQMLEQKLAASNVLLWIVGPRWLELLKERAAADGDYVRRELSVALERGIPILPVLVDGASLPSPDQLPSEMQGLTLFQKQDVSHEYFGRDMDALTAAISSLVPAARRRRAAKTWRIAAALTACLGALAIASVIWAPAFWGSLATPRPSHPEASEREASGKPAHIGWLETSNIAEGGKTSGDDTRQPGRVFRDCPDVCPELVVLGPGSFVMGDAVGREPNDEKPAHRVTIGQAFAVSRTEITFDDWDACVSDGGCRHKPDADWGRGKNPVVRVSWLDVVQQYIPWLSRKSGVTYRLLTEAEREYAAQGGEGARFPTGDSIDRQQARFSDRRTALVASYPANSFGLFDLAGNVWEWVADCYNETYSGVPVDGSAAREEERCLRVMRGGGWDSPTADLRTSKRQWARDDIRSNAVGFRVARPL